MAVGKREKELKKKKKKNRLPLTFILALVSLVGSVTDALRAIEISTERAALIVRNSFKYKETSMLSVRVVQGTWACGISVLSAIITLL